MKNLSLTLLLLALCAGCGADNPPTTAQSSALYTITDCPAGVWWNTDWEWACAPSHDQCIYEEWRFQWYYQGRVVERSYYNTPSNNNASAFWSGVCLDTSPWPSSWSGHGTVYRIPGDGPRLIYTWKRQTLSPTATCACYTSSNGVTWNSRTCFAFECAVGTGLGSASP